MKHSLIGAILISINLHLTNQGLAQDPQYTQYHNAPMYLNPAFVGLTGAGRAGSNYRIQGTNDDSRFTTISLYADYYIEDYNFSTGTLLLQDKEDFNGFRSTSVSVPLSYQFQINENLAVKPAVQASYNSRRIDFSDILFGDQLDPSGNVIGQSGENLRLGNKLNYFDLSFGILSYSRKWWGGISVHNLLEQNISFVEGGNSTLPVRYSIHGGYSHGVKIQSLAKSRERVYMPTFNYVRQGGFQQLDIGLMNTFGPVVFGAIYRGVPIGGSDKQALAPVIGLQMFDLSFAYSFDFVLNNATDPGGIHELSLTYLFNLKKGDPPRTTKRLYCPIPLNHIYR